jgi:hypothetical protein
MEGKIRGFGDLNSGEGRKDDPGGSQFYCTCGGKIIHAGNHGVLDWNDVTRHIEGAVVVTVQ